MQHLSDQDLLTIWEFGLQHSVIETNLFLLTLVYPEYNLNQVLSFPIGERDARLMQVRKAHFGPVLQNVSECDSCGQIMEWENQIEDLLFHKISEKVLIETVEMEHDEHHIRARLPNSRDIIEVLNLNNIDQQEDRLIQKCIVDSSFSNGEMKEAIRDFKDVLLQKMEEKDAQANIIMKLSCPECENDWNSTFDIMHYLWSEINEWGIQMMKDIYLLAQNFGWSEMAILQMSRFRRNLYLKMLNG